MTDWAAFCRNCLADAVGGEPCPNCGGTRILTHIDINYTYEIANLWVDPATRLRQIALVVLVWTHFAIGLHFWLDEGILEDLQPEEYVVDS